MLRQFMASHNSDDSNDDEWRRVDVLEDVTVHIIDIELETESNDNLTDGVSSYMATIDSINE